MTDPLNFSGQENRITFQLYEIWENMCDGEKLPTLKSLKPDVIAPYKDNLTLIDLRNPLDEASLQVIGHDLKSDLEEDLTGCTVSDIPRRTMLSRLTDHYLEVIANCAPISFEAEFLNNDRQAALYRGILLPFSDDGKTINFLLGAIRWVLEEETAPENNVTKNVPESKQKKTPVLQHEDNKLESLLERCRDLVSGEAAGRNRSRKSLYQSLGGVLDFYNICGDFPEEYRQLLQNNKLKMQARAPFTPLLKLCFGKEYDKTRLTEYAAALTLAREGGETGETLESFLSQFPGGIKGCVRTLRQKKRGLAPNKDVDHKNFRAQLLEMPAFEKLKSPVPLESEDDFCLILARKNGEELEVLSVLEEKKSLLDPLIQQAALQFEKGDAS